MKSLAVLLAVVAQVPIRVDANELMHVIAEVSMHVVAQVPMHGDAEVPMHVDAELPIHVVAKMLMYVIAQMPMNVAAEVLDDSFEFAFCFEDLSKSRNLVRYRRYRLHLSIANSFICIITLLQQKLSMKIPRIFLTIDVTDYYNRGTSDRRSTGE
jgi:hypothetical protein